LKRIFEYPVKCQRKGHEIGEGHLLLHILERVHVQNFSVDVPTPTKFPIKGHYLNSPLAVLVLSDGYEEPLWDCMRRQNFDERCISQLSEMVGMLISSQYSLLAFPLATHLHEGDPDGLVGFSICIDKALGLPYDIRATSLIILLVTRVQPLITDLKRVNANEHAIAILEATNAIDRLYTLLAKLLIYRQRNCRVLSCTRTPGVFGQATGWPAPYID